VISEVFIYIGYFILFLNCIVLLKGFSKNGKPFKIFTVYSLFMFSVQIAAHILVKMHMVNLFLSHFYFGLQFLLLSFFYYYLMKESFQKKTILIVLIVCSLLLVIQYLLDWSLFFKFSLFEIFITSLPLITYATFHLYNLLSEKKQFYYITIGLLIYLFGSTIVFLTANLLISIKSRVVFEQIYNLNVYLYVVYQLFILYDLKSLLISVNKKAHE
jgi:hypothetical protein